MRYRIGFLCMFCLSLFGEEQVQLKTPNISRENIIGTTVGVRPFRKTGVRLEAERLDDKLIIHNYGYGGSGLTLAFGGAKEVLDILDEQKSSTEVVAVLGAGVIGLATAYDLLEKGYEVHLYADEWTPNLTSNVGAGIWTPLLFPADLPEEKKRLHQRMLEFSNYRLLRSTGSSPEFAGVYPILSYRFKEQTSEESQQDISVHFDNGVTKSGRKFQEIGMEGQLFIDDLYAKVKAKGATLRQQRFDSLEEILSLDEPVIINCLSLGSRELFNDAEFIPVRGQMVYFKPQPEIDYLLIQKVTNTDTPLYYFTFIYPWHDRLILGGVCEPGEEELITDSEVIEKIIENGEKCLCGEPT